MTRLHWGYLIWAGWIVAFLALELTGYFRVAAWPTFSETVWGAESYPFVKLIVFAVLLALIAHFLYHRPLWHSVGFALVVAVAAHVFDRHLP